MPQLSSFAPATILASAFFAVAPYQLRAQVDSLALPPKVVREYTGEAVVVSSTRAGDHDPVSQSTIDATRLRNDFVGQDPQFLLDRTTPSIVSWSEAGSGFSNYGSFRLRGIDQTRVNVTLNGTPLNDMIDQGVFFSNITDLGNSLRSVQVQRGVGTTSNGTASFAGSVDFETIDAASRQPSASVQLTGGSFALRRLSAEVSTGYLNNGFAATARFTTFATDGFRQNSGTSTQSFFFSGGWYSETDIVRITGMVGSSANQLAYLGVPRDIAEVDPRTNVNDRNDRDNFGQHLVQLQHVHAFGSGASLQSTLYYGGAGGDFFVTFPDEQQALQQLNYPLRNDHVGLYSTLSSDDIGSGFGLTSGFHVYTFRRRNDEASQPNLSDPFYSDRTRKDEGSAFAKIRKVVGNVRAHAELQVRHVALTFTQDERFVEPGDMALPVHSWTFLNGLVGLEWTIVENLALWASVGVTNREPTRFDMLGSTQINSANISVLRSPNTVRSERVVDVETGVRHVADWGSVKVNGFLMRFADEIAPIGQFIEQQFVQLRKNVPSSTRMGFEADVQARIVNGISLLASGTVMSAVVDEYTPDNIAIGTLRNVNAVLTPSAVGNVSIVSEPFVNATAEVSFRYIGAMWLELTNSPGMQLPASAVFNARLGYRFGTNIRADVHLYNIFDRLYASNGATDTFEGKQRALWFVQAPRSVAVTVELRP